MEQRGAPPNSTGVVSRFDPVRTLELARRLQPDARQVVVVTGASLSISNGLPWPGKS